MPGRLRAAAFVTAVVLGQIALAVAAVLTNQKWLFAPLAPGLWCMRFLKANPQTAGSFIVFPTVAQTLLALGVNLAVYGALALVWMKLRRSHQ
jgi:hypothetical protein